MSRMNRMKMDNLHVPCVGSPSPMQSLKPDRGHGEQQRQDTAASSAEGPADKIGSQQQLARNTADQAARPQSMPTAEGVLIQELPTHGMDQKVGSHQPSVTVAALRTMPLASAVPMQRTAPTAALHSSSPAGSESESDRSLRPSQQRPGSPASSARAVGDAAPARDAQQGSPAASAHSSFSSEDYGIPPESTRAPAAPAPISHPMPSLTGHLPRPATVSARSHSPSAHHSSPIAHHRGHLHAAARPSSPQGPSQHGLGLSHARRPMQGVSDGDSAREGEWVASGNESVPDRHLSGHDAEGGWHEDGRSEGPAGLRASIPAKLRWSTSSASSSGASLLDSHQTLRRSASQRAQLRAASPSVSPPQSPSPVRNAARGDAGSGMNGPSPGRRSANMSPGSASPMPGLTQDSAEDRLRGSGVFKGRRRSSSSSNEGAHVAVQVERSLSTWLSAGHLVTQRVLICMHSVFWSGKDSSQASALFVKGSDIANPSLRDPPLSCAGSEVLCTCMHARYCLQTINSETLKQEGAMGGESSCWNVCMQWHCKRCWMSRYCCGHQRVIEGLRQIVRAPDRLTYPFLIEIRNCCTFWLECLSECVGFMVPERQVGGDSSTI